VERTHHRHPALFSRIGDIPVSAADLDNKRDSYMSTITQVLAAIIALLWGASLIASGIFGVQPGTNLGNVVVVVGVIVTLLGVDQLLREFRHLN
jgi:amino acid transporter